jgi:ferric-dicitrate binding protein FerR (iron transport regulator)
MEVLEGYWLSGQDKIEFEERETGLEKHLQRIRTTACEHEGTVTGFKITPWISGHWRALAIAASLITIIVLGVSIEQQHKGDTEPAIFKTITASKGTKNHFLLPDGSRVWLNAGSSLTYPTSFVKDSVRAVDLSGEAFFEIRHDENHPFVIHTEHMDIRDIGTSFNVKAYPDDILTEATLIEGSIEVKPKKSGNYTLLSTPNEKLTVFNKQPGIQLNKVREPGTKTIRETAEYALLQTSVKVNVADSLLAETAWLEDVLVFTNESFGELAVKLERWYDVTIRFEDEALKQKRFTGKFTEETIKQALEEIQLMKPFSFSIENSTITITE